MLLREWLVHVSACGSCGNLCTPSQLYPITADIAAAGTGTSDKCPADKKKEKGTICNDKTNGKICITGGKCDGKNNTCPAVKWAPTGTPCSKDGLYYEAVDDKGKVAHKGHYSDAKAEAHGWSTCQRCYQVGLGN